MSDQHAPRCVDVGLQNERTALAWRRTATALAVVVLLLGRTMLHDNLAWASVVTILGLAAATWIAAQSDHRYRRAGVALPTQGHSPDGRAMCLCSALGVGLGILVLAGLW